MWWDDRFQLGNISQERLEDCINSDLANNFGNLCQRVTAFAIKNCNSEVPKDIKFEKEDLIILERYKNNISIIRDKIDNQDINFYIDFIINSLFEANKYFNDQEPWKKKDNLTRLNTIIYTTLEIVRKISFLLYPIIPQSSVKALKIFDLMEDDINLTSLDLFITSLIFSSKGSWSKWQWESIIFFFNLFK